MTEQEYLSSVDPAALLKHLEGKLSNRQLHRWWDWSTPGVFTEDTTEVIAKRAALLRELAGNPFRPLLPGNPEDAIMPLELLAHVTPQWFSRDWLTSTVSSIARSVYDTNTWEEMPILADALLEAGCPEAHELVRHCQGYERCWSCLGSGCAPGSYLEPHCRTCSCSGWVPLRRGHVPGCWALDLLCGLE